MIKKLLSIALIFSGITVSAQLFNATYDFSLSTATSGTLDPTPPPIAAGITFSAFKAVGTPSANPNAPGRFSFTGWPAGASNGNDVYSSLTGSINLSEYYEVTLTPQAGYTVALNTIAFTVQRSNTGIRSYAVRMSVGNFSTNLPASVGTNSTLSVVGSDEFFWNTDAVTNAQNGSVINLFGATMTSPVSFRFYGWNSENPGGTFSIDNVVINGSASGSGSCMPPVVTSISSNSPCSTSPLLLQSSVTGTGPFTYTWFGNGSFSSTSVSNPTVTGASTGAYGLGISNACGTASAVVNVTVTPAPTVSVSATNSIICQGQPVTLTASGNATSYTWTNGVMNGTAFYPTTTSAYTVTAANSSCTNTAVWAVAVNVCTDIHETTNTSLFRIYPNPGKGMFKIASSVFPVSLTLYDITGKQVLKKDVVEMETAVDATQLNNGIYFITLTSGNTITHSKLVIAR